ncbi:MAG: hypothetical protein RBR38_15060 [Desulfomicrobium apsheronum]|nr:hypothetical protein [Desulfomicrobium apsheronum]
MTEKLRDILREPSSMYLVEAHVLSGAADAIDIQRKRADFFRDQLHALHECPPRYLDYPCKGRKGEPCPYLTDAGIPDYAACWDEVERRQR